MRELKTKSFSEPPREDLPAIFRLLEEALSVYGRRGIRRENDFDPQHLSIAQQLNLKTTEEQHGLCE